MITLANLIWHLGVFDTGGFNPIQYMIPIAGTWRLTTNHVTFLATLFFYSTPSFCYRCSNRQIRHDFDTPQCIKRTPSSSPKWGLTETSRQVRHPLNPEEEVKTASQLQDDEITSDISPCGPHWVTEATNCDIFDVAPFSKRPSSDGILEDLGAKKI